MSPTLDLEKLTLYSGAHKETTHHMCIMEAVAYVAGEPWSDHPTCASPVISAFLRSYNDAVDNKVRQTLKGFIPRLIGTASTPEVENRRAIMATDWMIRVYTPAWLRLAGLTANAEALESLPEITSLAQVPSIMGPLEAARQNAAAAWDAAWAAARDAARAAARAAALDWAAARAAARDAALAAARAVALDALKPTLLQLQATIPALIERMIDAGKP